MSKLVTDYMENNGTRFLWKQTPVKMEKESSGQIMVTYKDSEGKESEEAFDTVLTAVGKNNMIFLCPWPERSAGGI